MLSPTNQRRHWGRHLWSMSWDGMAWGESSTIREWAWKRKQLNQPTHQRPTDRPMWPWHHRTYARLSHSVASNLFTQLKIDIWNIFTIFRGTHARKIEPCTAAEKATAGSWHVDGLEKKCECVWLVLIGSNVFSCGNPLHLSEDERDSRKMWGNRNRCTCLLVCLIWAIEGSAPWQRFVDEEIPHLWRRVTRWVQLISKTMENIRKR